MERNMNKKPDFHYILSIFIHATKDFFRRFIYFIFLPIHKIISFITTTPVCAHTHTHTVCSSDSLCANFENKSDFKAHKTNGFILYSINFVSVCIVNPFRHTWKCYATYGGSNAQSTDTCKLVFVRVLEWAVYIVTPRILLFLSDLWTFSNSIGHLFSPQYLSFLRTTYTMRNLCLHTTSANMHVPYMLGIQSHLSPADLKFMEKW